MGFTQEIQSSLLRTQIQAAEMWYQARNSPFKLQRGGSSKECWVHNAEVEQNWVNTGLPAGNSGSQQGHRSRLQRVGEIRQKTRGSGCRR